MPSAQPEQLADLARWRRLAAEVLRRAGTGEDVDPVQALSTTTYEGLRIRPLYTAEDALHPPAPGRAPFVRGATAEGASVSGWDVRVRLADPDPRRAATAARTDLEMGATSLWLVLGPAGLAVADLPAVLDGVGRAPVVLDAGPDALAAADTLLAMATGEVAGSLGADPIGARARTGCAADPDLVPALAERAARHPRLLPVTVDASVYAGTGAGDADEVGIATAVGVAYLRALTDAGADVDEALRQLEFRFTVSADQFASIAKLRAARRVWDRVAELCGAGPGRRGQRQHAVTSAAMMTRCDPWGNILRTTVGCFAAAVGGADAVTVLPFDSAIGIPDGFGRRIARNTSAILHDESSLARVVDPAGGSWYVERLTDALATQAWEAFTAVERAGGALAALNSGLIAERIDAVRAAREDDLARRRAPLVGVSEFALLDEAAVLRPPAPAAPAGLLPSRREAEPWERLRERADAAAARTGRRPGVLLVALGGRSASAGRVAFAAGLFRAGGIEPTVVERVPEEPTEFAVACLCTSHELPEAAAALRRSGVRFVWLVGDAYVDGADGVLAPGGDALDILRRTLELLEVP